MILKLIALTGALACESMGVGYPPGMDGDLYRRLMKTREGAKMVKRARAAGDKMERRARREGVTDKDRETVATLIEALEGAFRR